MVLGLREWLNKLGPLSKEEMGSFVVGWGGVGWGRGGGNKFRPTRFNLSIKLSPTGL